MERKQFVLNLTIQVEANNEEEALELLSKEETLKSIAKAIESQKDQIQELNVETESTFLN